MQAYIKYEGYSDKKANASTLEQNDYVCVLQRKVDHQGSKTPFTGFCWTGPACLKNLYRIKLSGLQNWNTNNSKAISHASTNVQTQRTNTRRTNQVARKGTRS